MKIPISHAKNIANSVRIQILSLLLAFLGNRNMNKTIYINLNKIIVIRDSYNDWEKWNDIANVIYPSSHDNSKFYILFHHQGITPNKLGWIWQSKIILSVRKNAWSHWKYFHQNFTCPKYWFHEWLKNYDMSINNSTFQFQSNHNSNGQFYISLKPVHTTFWQQK